MKEKLEKYLKVLKIELEDLESDLELMADVYGQREKRDEITDYVYLENVSVLKTEILGINSIVESIDDIPVEQFTSLGEFVEYVDTLFRDRTEHASYPEGVYSLVKRKLEKVKRYIEGSE